MGDPYPPSQDATRGVQFDCDMPSNGLGTGLYVSDYGNTLDDYLKLPDLDGDVPGMPFPCDTYGTLGHEVQDEPTRFSGKNTALPRPLGRFPLGPTVVHLLYLAHPAGIMNLLLAWLEPHGDEPRAEHVKANVRDVDTSAYELTASVWVDHRKITMNAVLFTKDSPNRYALEFTRWEGDCITFVNFYRLAIEALDAAQAIDPEQRPKVQPIRFPLGPPPIDFLDDEEFEEIFGGEPMVDPLFNAAKMRDYPTQQAEAAAGLADAVSDGKLGGKVAQKIPFEVLMELMSCKLEDAGYQAARLVEALVPHAVVAETLLKRQEFQRMVAEKIEGDQSKLVKAEFRRVRDILHSRYGGEVKDLFSGQVADKLKLQAASAGAPRLEGLGHLVA
eukprot:SRR837773.6925.p1 GENE.SRR837773.6925~~SRR837773.6925.p1  ORF type:complete len:397 (-),score=109.63 SRR837773.6925:170-1333(-)